jgi:ribulose bisphosphate carboxylase small subunit
MTQRYSRGSDPHTTIKSHSNNGNSSSVSDSNDNGHLSGNIIFQVRSLLQSVHKMGTKFTSQRCFWTKSWLTGPAIENIQETEVIQALETFVFEYNEACV